MAVDELATDPSTLELVGETKRVDILRAMVEHRRARSGNEAIAFSDLFDRSSHDDKGNFNYHLGRLRGTLVEQTDDGYRLTSAGEIIAGSILSGVYDGPSQTLPVDETCPGCQTTVSVHVEAGWTGVECENGHLLLGSCLPPGVADGRSAEDVLRLAIRHWQQVIEFSGSGTCIKCFGPERGQFVPLDSGETSRYQYETCCERCGHFYRVGPVSLVLRHPAVVALCHDNGIDPYETPPWMLPFLDWANVTVHETTPFRIELALSIGDDEVRFTLDREGEIVEFAEDR